MIVLFVDKQEKGDSHYSLQTRLTDKFNGTTRIIQSAEIVYFALANLTEGDYHIVYYPNGTDPNDLDHDSGILLEVIERKTLDDFAASFKKVGTKTRDDNVLKMLQVRERQPTCKLSYLIEGKVATIGASFQGISMKNIQMSLFTKQREYGMNIIWTGSINDTVDKLKMLCEWYSKNIGKTILLSAVQDSYCEVMQDCKPTEEEEMYMRVMKVWKGLDKIGATTAPTLCRHISLMDLISGKVDLAFLAALEAKGVKFKSPVVGTLIGFQTNKSLHEKLYSSVHNFGKKRAAVLTSRCNPSDVAAYLSGQNNCVKEIKSGNKAVIGAAARKNWAALFNWKAPENGGQLRVFN